jgi:hypothetical protein
MDVTGKEKVKGSGNRKGIECRLARLEERLAKVEENQARILQVLRLGPAEDAEESSYNRAIGELAQGNRKPLENFLKRGGKIPKG